MERHKTKINSEKIVSVSAIVIAVASIVVTIWQGMEMRKHNRLSVKPRLEISYEAARDYFGYVLTNKGLGPAVITYRKFFIDGQELNYQGFSGYEDFIEKLGMKGHKFSSTSIYPGQTVLPNERVNIIRFYYNDDDKPETLIPQIYRRVRMEIGYQSMYQEDFVCRLPHK